MSYAHFEIVAQRQKQSPELQLNLALVYHPKRSQNAGYRKASRRSSIAHSAPREMQRTVSSAGGAERNCTDEQKAKREEGDEKLVFCSRLCVLMDMFVFKR